jgi:hypothetical protein
MCSKSPFSGDGLVPAPMIRHASIVVKLIERMYAAALMATGFLPYGRAAATGRFRKIRHLPMGVQDCLFKSLSYCYV